MMNMSSQNQTSISGIGGASSGSAPQLSPIFSYQVNSGVIRVYAASAGLVHMTIITLQDRYGEGVCGYDAFDYPEKIYAYDLVTTAYKHLYERGYVDQDNPFYQLITDDSTMAALGRAILNAFGGEDA